MEKKSTTIRISEAVLKEAKIEAINTNIALSQYIENLITNDLEDKKKSTC